MARAILFDSTLCIGCRACEEACAKKWGHTYNQQVASRERLSAGKLTTIQTHADKYMRKLCMHCLDPTCASVCPVGAMQKTPLGPVVYHQDKCIGCRYCMVACPFQVPVYTWSEPKPVVKKCDMCFARLRNGQSTACSEACAMGATVTGTREELLAEARRRIAEKPDQYTRRIYGYREAGGTSVLVLAAVPFAQLGLPAGLGEEPLPRLTWNALSHVPDVVSLGSLLLGGVWWIAHRREEVAEAEGRKGRKL